MFGTLNVYLKNRFCGQVTWESERNRFVFRYAAEYLADPAAERLSFALPLRAEPFDEDVSYNFFANLLPPEVVRRKADCRSGGKGLAFADLRKNRRYHRLASRARHALVARIGVLVGHEHHGVGPQPRCFISPDALFHLFYI